jgi:hypothetical protein
LVEDDRLGLDAVPLLQALVRHRDEYGSARSVVVRQHSIEYRRPDRVATSCYVERKLGRQLTNTRRAAALLLRPYETQVRAIGWRRFGQHTSPIVRCCVTRFDHMTGGTHVPAYGFPHRATNAAQNGGGGSYLRPICGIRDRPATVVERRTAENRCCGASARQSTRRALDSTGADRNLSRGADQHRNVEKCRCQ